MGYIRKIRELLKDPKKKSLTILGLYFIFFIFVFVFLNTAERPANIPSEPKEKSPFEYYEDMTGYNYKITYTNMDKIDIIEGSYYDNKSIFTYNNVKYYYEDSLYVIDNDTYYLGNIEYNISKIFSSNLSTIIEDLDEQSKTMYKDGTIITNYTIDSNKIYNYLYGLESTYNNLVSVNITESANNIHNVVIDLTNLGLNLTKIEVEYSDLNEITDLSFNKDNYTYKESL